MPSNPDHGPMIPGVANYGVYFLHFHRHFITEVLGWASGQGMDLTPFTPWDALPNSFKTDTSNPPWNPSNSAMYQSLTVLVQPFNTEDQFGAALSGGFHSFLHNKGVFGEPALGDFNTSPTSTYFYQIHGLVERMHQHWLNWKRSAVIETSAGLYARSYTDGTFYKMNAPLSWTQISTVPGQMFVAVGTSLYRLALDGNTIAKYSGSGTTWSTVGGPTYDIFRCGSYLCARDPAGNIKRSVDGNNNWTSLSGSVRNSASSSATWFAVDKFGLNGMVFNESTRTFTTMDTLGGDLFVSDTDVFESSPLADTDNDGSIWHGEIWHRTGSSTTSWERIGGGGRTFIAIGSNFYGITPSGSGVNKWTPNSSTRNHWDTVGGAADWLYGTTHLYATNPSSQHVYRYDGTGWTDMGRP
jgi:hypothetical protein